MAEKFSLGSVQVALSPRERFEEYLQSRGMRNTEQRRVLVDHIFSHHEHFDADQLIAQLPPKGSKGYVSRPTVYRTLAEFVDAGLLRKFELNGRSVYEHDYGYPQHDHLYCNQCHKLLEFQSDELIDLRNRVALEQQFRVTGHRLIVYGTCQECTASRRRLKRRVDQI
ncbi:MAG: transcriptional repressor [Planctomycetaceae bacterium]|nr:MAG: transcriptional repressor [Planctomycetaceae bacterium]